MGDTEKDLMNLRYLNVVNRYRYVNYETSSSFKCNMDNSKELKDRERIANQIAKMSDSIHKKYDALKTYKIEEDSAGKTL